MDKKARYKFIYQSLNASIIRAEKAKENLQKLKEENHLVFMGEDLEAISNAIATLDYLNRVYKNRYDKEKRR